MGAKGWIYDLQSRTLERSAFSERRRLLVTALEGDVLEVGAGTGLNTPLYERAGRVVALEPSHSYLPRLRARAREALLPVEVFEGFAESLPFPACSFDHVVTTITLCSVRDLDASLAEIRRVLRPGGSLVFLEHVRASGRVGRWQDRLTPLQSRLADGCHLNRDTAAAIERAGLRLTKLERFSIPSANPLIRTMIQGIAVKEPS